MVDMSNEQTADSVLIVGCGGVGTIAALGLEIGGKARVTAAVRGDYNKIVEYGFDIDSVDHGSHTSWRPSRVVSSVEEAAEVQLHYDWVIVCTKVLPELYKTEDIIRPVIRSSNTGIVLIQNGIDIEAPVAAAYPDNVVLSGVSMIGSQNFHGKILHNEHDKIQIGYYASPAIDGSRLKHKCLRFVDIYSASGVDCSYTDDLSTSRWRKLVYNSCINTACAAVQLDAGRMYLSGCDQSLILPAMKEILAIAHAARGKPLPDGIDIAMLESDDGVYYKPSMQVDIEKGNPIELEAILGNPLRIAQRHNVQAPILNMLYHILKGVQFRLMESRGLITLPEQAPHRKDSKPIWSYPYN